MSARENDSAARERDRAAFEEARESYSRRQVLQAAAGVAFFCSTINLPGKSMTQAPKVLGRRKPLTSAARKTAARKAFAPFERDLPIPTVLQPSSLGGDADEYQITMQPGTAEILPGLETPILGYNGTFPGPTIKARVGRKVVVRQRNELGTGQDAVVHLHGGVTEAASDGHPMDLIPEGAERVYTYDNEQPGALLWYHDHAHGYTARSVYEGLAGMYLLREDLEDELELPQGDFEVPLMIADRSFATDGSFAYPNQIPLGQGFLGDTVLVNGAVVPRFKVKQRLYRLRILNASNARVFRLAFGNKIPFWQIGTDNALLPKPVKRKAVSIGPAERVDLIFDFRQFRKGSTIRLRNLNADNASVKQIMRFDVGGKPGNETARVPKKLRPLESIPGVAQQRTFRLSLRQSPTMEWQINGRGYSDDRIDIRPRAGTTEIWHFVNDSAFYHPMHTHLGHFQVLSVGGRKPHKADRGWKDTVMVGANETAIVKVYFPNYTGRYVYHCHALEHGDVNMMGQMEVTA